MCQGSYLTIKGKRGALPAHSIETDVKHLIPFRLITGTHIHTQENQDVHEKTLPSDRMGTLMEAQLQII